MKVHLFDFHICTCACRKSAIMVGIRSIAVHSVTKACSNSMQFSHTTAVVILDQQVITATFRPHIRIFVVLRYPLEQGVGLSCY